MPGSLRRGQKGCGFVLLKRWCGKGNDIGIMLRQKRLCRRQERLEMVNFEKMSFCCKRIDVGMVGE